MKATQALALTAEGAEGAEKKEEIKLTLNQRPLRSQAKRAVE